MEISRAKYLMEALINNKLSVRDLDDLIRGLENDDIKKAYSDVLEAYFDHLLKENPDKL